MSTHGVGFVAQTALWDSGQQAAPRSVLPLSPLLAILSTRGVGVAVTGFFTEPPLGNASQFVTLIRHHFYILRASVLMSVDSLV